MSESRSERGASPSAGGRPGSEAPSPNAGAAERWHRIETLFREALGLLPEQREAFVHSRCGLEEREVAEEVLHLLAYDAEEDGPLDAPVWPGAARSEESPPERVGPYRVLRCLGAGLFSQVFLAVDEATAEAEPVAVKLLRVGTAPRQLRRRFLLERRALGSLDHPNIARLLDGGSTDDGVPYFVMEYVDGLPIDAYCAHRGLSVAQRVALVRQVCAAVEHAHQRFFVHRDLKPSNILVTASGSPKLLDFGIAKLLDPEGSATPSALSSLWWRPLTPQYASPEQVVGSPITAASDVYSLGVLLYRLLSGRLPYELDGAGPREVERIICSQVPALASVAAAEGEAGVRASGPTESDARPPGKDLPRQLAGDLDRIVARALEKAPARRYASVERLSEDLRRYLDGEPVEARRDASWTYRTAKFIRRHRLSLSIAGAFVALLVAFAATMAVQAGRIARERDRAERERDRAERIAGFLQQIFDVAEPGSTKGEELTAREILDRGTERIERELASQPEDQANLLNTIGQVYTRLGLYDRAKEVLDRSLELRRRAEGGDEPDVAESLNSLAVLLDYRGEHPDAEALAREALRLRREAPGLPQSKLAESLQTLADSLAYQGRYDEAEGLYREALAIRRRDGEPEDLAGNLNSLGALLDARGDYEEGEALLRQALDLRRRTFGDLHPQVSSALQNLAGLLRHRGDYAEAEALYREALAIDRMILGPRHPFLATTLNNLAVLLHAAGAYADAEPLYREALAISRETLGPEHPRLASSIQALGMLLRDRGELEEAEALNREALALHRRLLGDRHPDVAWDLHDLAGLMAKKGDRKQAETLYRQALELRRESLGDHHPAVASTLAELGLLLLEGDDPLGAEPLLREGLAIRREKLPAGHWYTAWNGGLLGACLLRLGRPEEAEPLLAEARDVLGTAPGDQSERLKKLDGWLGEVSRLLRPQGTLEISPRG